MEPADQQPGQPEPIRVPAGATGAAPVPPANALEDAPAPTPEALGAATDGDTLAARLRAKHAELQRGTRRFDVPGWDGDLVMVAKVLRDRKQIAEGLTNEQLVVEATVQVLARTEDGGERDLGGWAGVGDVMGLAGEGVTLGAIVRGVLDNPLRLDAFAEQLVAWMTGRQSAIERLLGG